MQRKSLALIAIALTLFTVFMVQMAAVQAAAPQQAGTDETPVAAADEPQPLPQPIRIRVRQTIPFTIAVVPTMETTPTAELAAEPVDTGEALTPTAVAAGASAPVGDQTDASTPEPAEEAAAVSEAVTETVETTPTMLVSTIPVTFELDFDLVVSQTLTTTVPASVTLQLPDAQTTTLPVSITVGLLPDASVVVELLPLPPAAATPEPTVEATPEVTPTIEATPEVTPTVAEAPATPSITTTLATEINGLPLINTTVTVSSNLRAGPSTDFEILTQAGPGDAVQIVAVSEDGQWYLLATGAWIANFLVADQPTNVPTVTDEILAAVQGTAPVPTATPTPEAAAVTPPTVTVDANLRAGPGTEFDIIGGTITGDVINIVGRNAEGTWFRLDNGGWVLGTLVTNAPAIDTVPVLNNDGTPVEPAATPTEEVSLSGLLPTPTPIPGVSPATYLAAATGIISQYDSTLTSIDGLLAELASNNAVLTDANWNTRLNAALALLRRTSATVGELRPPAALRNIQQELESAAVNYNLAAQALSSLASTGDLTLLDDVETAIQQANTNLTNAEIAIGQAGG